MNIKIENLSFSYGDTAIYNNFNLSISGPGLYALTGPNGSGKTTLLKLIAKQLSKDSGSIIVNNEEIETENYPHISYIEGDEYLFDHLTVKETLLLFRIDLNILDVFNLADIIDQKCISLSKGERQRLYLLIMLETAKDIILMDEATANLDKETEAKIFARIKELSKDKLIIYVTNNIDCYKFADEIIDIYKDSQNFSNDKSVIATNNNFKYKMRDKCFNLKITNLLSLITVLLFIVSSILVLVSYIYDKKNLYYNNASHSLDTISLLSKEPRGYTYNYIEEDNELLGLSYNNKLFSNFYVSFTKEINGYNISKNEMIISSELYDKLPAYCDENLGGETGKYFENLSGWNITRENGSFYFTSVYDDSARIKVIPSDVISFKVFYMNKETFNSIIGSLYELLFEGMDMYNPDPNAVLSLPYTLDIRGMITTSIKLDKFVIDSSLSGKQIVTNSKFSTDKIYFIDNEIDNIEIIKTNSSYTRISVELATELMEYCDTVYANEYASSIYVNVDNINEVANFLLDNNIFLYNNVSENIYRIITYGDNIVDFYIIFWVVFLVMSIVIIFLSKYLFCKTNQNSIKLFKALGFSKKNVIFYLLKKDAIFNIIIIFGMCLGFLLLKNGIRYDNIVLYLYVKPVILYLLLIGIIVAILIEQILGNIFLIYKYYNKKTDSLN